MKPSSNLLGVEEVYNALNRKIGINRVQTLMRFGHIKSFREGEKGSGNTGKLLTTEADLNLFVERMKAGICIKHDGKILLSTIPLDKFQTIGKN